MDRFALGWWLSQCSPFLFAGTVLLLFKRADRLASPAANKAISNWLKGEPSKNVDLTLGVLGIFDAIYSKPLFSFAAFARSALVTTLVTVLFVNLAYPMAWPFFFRMPEMRGQWVGQITTNVISDYLSLFLVRYCLVIARQRLLLAVIGAPLVGIAIVMALYVIRDVAIFSIWTTGTFELRYFPEGAQMWMHLIANRGSAFAFLVPAFVVHCWLLLLVPASLLTLALGWIFRAFEIARWFIRSGYQHPLLAIGYVASGLVFIAVAIVRLALEAQLDVYLR